MSNINAPNCSSATASAEVGVLFVDLDETLIEGTAINMSNEEIRKAELIKSTLNKIKQARLLGIKVVMATRNTHETIERVLSLRSDLNAMFNDTLSCLGTKSDQINNYLQTKRTSPEKAVFIDDTEGELIDVERNSGVTSIKTGKTDFLTLKKVA